MLIFAACLLSFLGKALALVSPFCYDGGYFLTAGQKWQVVATTLATIFLPGLLLGIVSSWHRGILKTFLIHPSIILMPAFTHFTFASSTKWCKRSVKVEGEDETEEDKEGGKEGKSEGEAEVPYITFSATLTLANVVLSAIGSVSYSLILTQISTAVRETHKDNDEWEVIGNSSMPYLLYYYFYNPRINFPFILVPLLGPFLTLLSLVSISKSLPLPACFSLPKVEYGAFLPSQIHSNFVLDANDEPKLVPEYEEVKLEEVKIEESVKANNEEAETVEKEDDEMVEPGQDNQKI